MFFFVISSLCIRIGSDGSTTMCSFACRRPTPTKAPTRSVCPKDDAAKPPQKMGHGRLGATVGYFRHRNIRNDILVVTLYSVNLVFSL